jgi:hypothetical protein
MGLLTVIVIALLILVVLGIGVGATWDAIKAGWEKVPAQNITDNFKEAAEKSAKELVQEIEP